jgi:hypothetical protein
VSRFSPVTDEDLVASVPDSSLGFVSPFPRPDEVYPPFGEFEIRHFEAHVSHLETINNKGKVDELTYARNLASYLFEAALYCFLLVHHPANTFFMTK